MSAALILVLAHCVTAGQGPDGFSRPAWSPDARYLALSDADRNGVYVYDTLTDGCLRVTESPSSGYAYRWSPVGRQLGFKLLVHDPGHVFPQQIPAIYDLDRGEIISLHAPVGRAGVPSFSNNGHIAFTIDRDMWITDESGSRIEIIGLDHYANLAPISPDGTMFAYNDADDRICVVEIATGRRRLLTTDGSAYFNPVWSPDSRCLAVSTVGGLLKAIDVSTGLVIELDEGTDPAWGPDGQTIFYCQTIRIDGRGVESSDLHAIRRDGTGWQRLPVDVGVRPSGISVSSDGRRIAYTTLGAGNLYHATLVAGSAQKGGDQSEVSYSLDTPDAISAEALTFTSLDQSVKSFIIEDGCDQVVTATTAANTVVLTRPVPYIHQVYDTPDAFDGNWACGATSAMMAMNYFDVLPHWDVTCSWPVPHVSHWGRYISEIYTFNGRMYDIRSRDASSKWAYGGYGYIVRNNWADTKGYMRDYINNHGLSSGVDWSPSWTKLQTEVNNDDPFVLLNSLTTAGHYIVTIGYYTDRRTAMFNDPYGNKNTSGYPSYDGAGVYYDWPGYNNGFANLNTVHCFIYCRGGSSPVITSQPQSREVAKGEDVSFSVTATGQGTLTYQWSRSGIDLIDGAHYSGTTSSTLWVIDSTDQQVGEYRCRVSVTFKSTTSNPATLAVLRPPVAPGDLDWDGDVDQEDYGAFQRCLTGSAVHQTAPDCVDALLDGDSDVDANDTRIFLECMTGAGIPADLNCAGG